MNPSAIKGLDFAWHQIRRTFGVIAVLGILGLIGYSVYVTIIKPHTSARMATSTTNQQAKKIVNQHLTIQEENCWVNLLGIKTLCFKNKAASKIIKKEGQLKLEKKE